MIQPLYYLTKKK